MELNNSASSNIWWGRGSKDSRRVEGIALATHREAPHRVGRGQLRPHIRWGADS